MKFSIVIPTYNGARYIKQAIESVLSQKRHANEIIISDDNSTDETIEICKQYEGQLKIYINEEGPSGFVNGWNQAIAKATGDYVSILHQDDLLHPDFLKEAENALIQHPHVMHLFAVCNYIDENEKKISLFPKQKENIHIYEGLEYIKAYQRKHGGMPHIHRCPGVLTHRSIFEKMQYDPKAGHIADDDFFYKVGQYTQVAGILFPLASYRMHRESETGKLDDTRLVKRLIDDYIYQLNQWKDSFFLDKEAYNYFKFHIKMYIKRYVGYGLKSLQPHMGYYALKMYIKYLRTVK